VSSVFTAPATHVHVTFAHPEPVIRQSHHLRLTQFDVAHTFLT